MPQFGTLLTPAELDALTAFMQSRTNVKDNKQGQGKGVEVSSTNEKK
jgi:hypothetical protein